MSGMATNGLAGKLWETQFTLGKTGFILAYSESHGFSNCIQSWECLNFKIVTLFKLNFFLVPFKYSLIFQFGLELSLKRPWVLSVKEGCTLVAYWSRDKWAIPIPMVSLLYQSRGFPLLTNQEGVRHTFCCGVLKIWNTFRARLFREVGTKKSTK